MNPEKNVKRALTLLLPLCLALAGGNVSAQESLVDGASVTDDDSIDSTAPDTLANVAVAIPASTSLWHCVVTGSADVVNPLNGDDNQYIFGLSVDTSASTMVGSDRTIDFDNLTGEETNRQEVSSTFPFMNLTAGVTHTFRLSARKVDSGDVNMNVEDSSITAVCSDNPG